MSRPDWLQRKIDFTLARQRHIREAPPGCRCPFCLTTEQIDAEFRAILARERERTGPPPF